MDSSDQRDILEHSRNFSTVSSATLITNTTHHSQPTEPLLQPSVPGEVAESYFDQVARQPRNPDGTPARLQWHDSHTLETDPIVVGEKGRGRGRRIGKRSQRWKRVKQGLEIIMAIWAVYNTVRYFLAFPIYTGDASMGQDVCFALGTSSGLSCIFSLCALGLTIVKRKLLLCGLPFKYLDYICSSLHYLSSICLLGPAATNFAILFIWKHSTNSLYDLNSRCHIDIDVIWSASTHPCNDKAPSTAMWITLSSLRLAVTLIIIIAYHAMSLLRPHYPHRLIHHRLRSELPMSSTPLDGASSAMMLPNNHDLRAQHQISDATLNAIFQGEDLSRPPSRLRLARSRSSGLSAETFTPGESISFGRSALSELDSDRDLTGHMDRFRSLVTQINQETEAALEFAGVDSAENSRETHPAPSSGLPPAYSEDEEDEYETDGLTHGSPDNIFNLPPVPAALGYNEFGMPYPPDQAVRILNGYIRRMPTIESMGSGEIGTSIGASSHRAGSNSSRPPTRNTLLSSNEFELNGSQPPSRANSLSARAELLAGMSNINGTSEHGELQSRSDIAFKRVSSPTSFLESPLMDSHGDAYSTGSHSTTLSYHTATMGSHGDSYPPGFRKNEPSS